MIFSISKHLVRFFIILFLVFIGHIFTRYQLDLVVLQYKIVAAYVVNYLVAAVVMVFLFVVRKKHKDNLGYLYLIGSGLKFIAFYFFFLPSYRADGVIDKQEFFTFFIPYVSSLILETFTLIQLLEFLDKSAKKKLKNKELK